MQGICPFNVIKLNIVEASASLGHLKLLLLSILDLLL